MKDRSRNQTCVWLGQDTWQAGCSFRIQHFHGKSPHKPGCIRLQYNYEHLTISINKNAFSLCSKDNQKLNIIFYIRITNNIRILTSTNEKTPGQSLVNVSQLNSGVVDEGVGQSHDQYPNYSDGYARSSVIC